MKTVLKISMYLFLLFLLTAEDCSNSTSKTVSAPGENDIFQNLQNDFESDELDEPTLLLFEKRGIQKLQDLFDYLNIYADSSLDINFREQAKQMISERFVSKYDIQNFYNQLDVKEVSSKIIVLHSNCAFTTQTDSIFVRKKLKLQGLQYVGELQFKLLLGKNLSKNGVDFVDYNCRAQICALKASKQFGTENLDVWEVYLDKLVLY